MNWIAFEAKKMVQPSATYAEEYYRRQGLHYLADAARDGRLATMSTGVGMYGKCIICGEQCFSQESHQCKAMPARGVPAELDEVDAIVPGVNLVAALANDEDFMG